MSRRFKGYAFRGGYLGNAWLCDDETGRCWWSDDVTENRVLVPDAEGVKAYRERGPGFGVQKVVKIFATRKPKPAPLVCWKCGETSGIFDGDEHHDGSIETCYCGAPNAITYFVDGTWALTRPSGVNEDGSPEEVDDDPKPAPVVAGEGLFAVLTEDSGDAHFQDINDGSDGFPRDAQRSIGSREMAIAFVGRWPGNKLVRILADGEHEAAVEAAVRAERERVLSLVAAERERVRGKTSDGYLYALDWFEEAAKGQAK